MKPAGDNLGRFPSKFLLMVIPGLVASGVVASVLYAVHVSRAPTSSEFLTDLTPQGDGLSAEERRGLTRQMLKDRRENPQEPAEVRPTLTSRPADDGPSKDSAVDARATGDAKGNTTTVKAAADRTPSDHTPADRAFAAAPLPVARPTLAPGRSDGPVVATTPAPTVMPPAPAAPLPLRSADTKLQPPTPAPTVTPPAPAAPLPLRPTDTKLQPPTTVNPSSGAEPEPEPRGLAANVFSSLSSMVGTAANATGNTVNWVIDLPGKAISAGGRLFGGDSSTSNQPAGPPPSAGNSPPPAALPPPATAPPPRRNL